jgi:hypothetical protein
LGGSQQDIDEVGRCLDRLFRSSAARGSPASRKINLAWERGMRQLVKRPEVWRAIEILAAALLEKETISGREATTLIEGIIRPRTLRTAGRP